MLSYPGVMFNVLKMNKFPINNNILKFVSETYKQYFKTPYEPKFEKILVDIILNKRLLLTFNADCFLIISHSSKNKISLDYFASSKFAQRGVGKFCLNNLLIHLKYKTSIKMVELECTESLLNYYKQFNPVSVSKNLSDPFYKILIYL